MARYTGPKSRIARKFGEGIFGADKVLSKKNYPPGQHGNSRKRKTSEYGVQLREKQKAKYTYGVLEKQFRNLFEKAETAKGITGEILLQLLEGRLDNIVFRLGIAPTRAAARQLVSHKHITVDGDVVNIPPEVKHWHGAAKDSWFAHLAVEVPAEGASNEWLEVVNEEDYEKLK